MSEDDVTHRHVDERESSTNPRATTARKWTTLVCNCTCTVLLPVVDAEAPALVAARMAAVLWFSTAAEIMPSWYIPRSLITFLSAWYHRNVSAGTPEVLCCSNHANSSSACSRDVVICLLISTCSCPTSAFAAYPKGALARGAEAFDAVAAAAAAARSSRALDAVVGCCCGVGHGTAVEELALVAAPDVAGLLLPLATSPPAPLGSLPSSRTLPPAPAAGVTARSPPPCLFKW